VRNAPAELDQRTDRVRLYSYSDAGSDGVVDSQYTFVDEVWAQFKPDRASERTSSEAATHERRATFGFHERVSVDNDMVITINGEAYRVDGIPDPRTYVDGMLRLVSAIWVDRAELTLAEV
jgi:SPP1 family predicted phage head-tail adaptor